MKKLLSLLSVLTISGTAEKNSNSLINTIAVAENSGYTNGVVYPGAIYYGDDNGAYFVAHNSYDWKGKKLMGLLTK